MALQVHRFPDGGYAAHGLRISDVSTMRYSVWFDAEGRVVDCESKDCLNRVRPVGHEIRKHLAKQFDLVVAAHRAGA